MTFKFGLETLLEIRTNKEEESKRNFNKSQRELQEKLLKKQDLLNQYERYSGINKGESLVYQKLKKNYLFELDKGINKIEQDIEVKTKEVNYRREELKKKQMERKTVDILKEKQYHQYITEENKKEQIQNDEFALYAYMRNIERR